MQILEKLSDILLRRLDTLINPKIENRVIYGLLFSGIGLVAVPKLIPMFQFVEVHSESFELLLKLNEGFELVPTLLGFILLIVACVLLFLFKIHNRPELVIKSASSIAHRWHELPYSFLREEYIHPKIIKDLIGWISDTGQQIVSINLSDSNKSNRYFGQVTIREFNEKVFIECDDNTEKFSYEYLGTSESGVHVLHTVDYGKGSGCFHYLVFVVLEQDEGIQYEEDDKPKLVNRPLIRMIGRICLGDRYEGKVIFDKGVIRVRKDKSPAVESIIDRGFSIIVR
jgi:hypothetical protein